MRKMTITAVLILISLVLTSSALSFDAKTDVGKYSQKLYEDRDEARVICGDFRVIAFSDYRISTTPQGRQSQHIVRQYFEFTDFKNGNQQMVRASTMDIIDGTNKKLLLDSNDEFINRKDSYLDGNAYSWDCLKGKNDYYLAIFYGNGGSCRNCEWIEIMNRKGEVIIRSIKNSEEDNHKQYQKVLSELGLPPRSQTEPNREQRIKLRKIWLNDTGK
jgi:hypothetical protein